MPKWLSHQGRILAKEQFHNSYTFWAMPILIFGPVQIIMSHPLFELIKFAKSKKCLLWFFGWYLAIQITVERFWLLCNWFFLRSFQLIRHAYFSIIFINRIKMVWIIKCPDITYLLGPCYLLFELKQVCKIKKMPTLIFWTIFSHHRNRFFLRSFQQIRNRWLIFRVLPSIQYLKCNCKKR